MTPATTAADPNSTMSRDSHQPVGRRREHRPFDPAADDTEDLTQTFWGRSRGWDDHTPVEGVPLADATHEFDAATDDAVWAHRTGAVDAVRAAFTTRRNDQVRRMRRPGGIDRTRSHGIVRPDAPRPDGVDHPTGPTRRVPLARGEASLGELAAGHADALDWDDDDWDLIPANTQRHAVVSQHREPVDRAATGRMPAATARARRSPDVEIELDDRRPARRSDVRRSTAVPLAERLGLGAVDPLLLRLGVLILTGVLAVPVAFGMRDGDTGSLASADGATAGIDVGTLASTGAAPTIAPAAQPAAPAATVATAADEAAAAVAAASEPDDDSASEGRQAADVATVTEPPATEPAETSTTTTTTAAGLSNAATVTQDAERVEPVCALEYEAAAGDSWYRIAESAGIGVDELLAANLADLDAPIFPGDEICLPEGASMPTAPTTTTAAAPTTTTAPATTTTTTTVAPTTTTVASSGTIASRDEVQALIREIWPDELEEKALQIAKRESNYYADAYNGWCCYGVFQLYYTVHRSWLDDFGINQASDLYDARKNITAAYALYQRSGGWGPWGG